MTTELDFFINSLHDEGIDTIKVLNDLNDFFDGDAVLCSSCTKSEN